MTTFIGAFGAPPDAVARAAMAAALVASAYNAYRARSRGAFVASDRAVVIVLALVAALLSAGYVAYYLRGGPRIIDATSYYLEARAFSEGHVAMPVPSPSGSFRGRFLFGLDGGKSVSVIFPPGYPAVLALGFLAGAPMLVGPVLAAALVVATFALALRLFGDARVARLAAALSALCAVLRYHTADTMSHGLAALLLALSLVAALDSRRSTALVAGVAAGSLIATRPFTGALGLALVLGVARPTNRLGPVLLGTVLPVSALLIEQRLATGAWLVSSQAAYYAVADGPIDCFRYGFGASVGCRFEHGDFVRAHLEHGYGFLAAIGTTLRRLKMHLADAGNVELFMPILVYALVRSFAKRTGRIAAAGVIGIVVVYAPFYFDGNYPGGGARFFADALPLEHCLIAWALSELRLESFAVPAALLGFAFHTSYDHRQLAERDGGRPMFERSVVGDAGIARGLVFVSTDHGFNLGFDPEAGHAGTLVVARRRHDAHDALLWQALGRPDAYEYAFDPGVHGAVPSVSRIKLDLSDVLRFEAESEWPPLAVSNGFVEPAFPPCASRSRALWITPSAGKVARVVLEAPGGGEALRRMRVGWVAPTAGPVAARFTVGSISWDVRAARLEGCGVAEGPVLRAEKPSFIEISVESPMGIDFVEARPPG